MAAGVPYDIRKAYPYLGYETYQFDIPTQTEGDAYARYLIRMEEMRQSASLIEQALNVKARTGDYQRSQSCTSSSP